MKKNILFFIILIFSIANTVSMEKKLKQSESSKEILIKILSNVISISEKDLPQTLKALEIHKIINEKIDNDGNTFLHLALKNQHHLCISNFIEILSSNINIQNKLGCAPLHFAVQFFDKAIDILLKNKANANIRDKNGQIAINYAIKYNNPEAFSKLVNLSNIESKDNDGATLLHHAAQYCPELIKNLMLIGFRVEEKDEQGRTALHYAVLFNPNSIKPLLKLGASLDTRDKKNLNPVNHAIINNIEAIKTLLENGLTFKELLNKENFVLFDSKVFKLLLPYKDENGLTFLHFAAQYNLELTEVILGNFKRRGIDNEEKDINGATPLHYAQKEMAQLLVKNNASLSAKDNQGAMPIHYAAKYNPKTLKWFIKQNVDIEAEDNQKNTPLHYAVEANNKESAEILLKNKANVNSQNINGHTPLHIALNSGCDLVELLLENEANLESHDKQANNILHLAIEKGNVEILKIILKYTKNLESKNNQGYTPLAFADYLDKMQIAKALIDFGADFKNIKINNIQARENIHFFTQYNDLTSLSRIINNGTNIDSKDKIGWSALHYSAKYNPNAIKFLLDLGANIEAIDDKGKTPFNIAMAFNKDAVRILIANGAKPILKKLKESNNTQNISNSAGTQLKKRDLPKIETTYEEGMNHAFKRRQEKTQKLILAQKKIDKVEPMQVTEIDAQNKGKIKEESNKSSSSPNLNAKIPWSYKPSLSHQNVMLGTKGNSIVEKKE